MPGNNNDSTVVCHSNYGSENGSLATISLVSPGFSTYLFPTGVASGKDPMRKPVLLGINPDRTVVLMNPETKEVTTAAAMPSDAVPTYAYRDTARKEMWFVNDGDEETGVDSLNCGNNGSSATIVSYDGPARVLKTVCVGRGHHVTTFVSTRNGPRAFLSNLEDGTISVLNNDSASKDRFTILATINLCEPEKEKSGATLPNSAYPHGMVFSPKFGELYNLNNGYGTIAVIDPDTYAIKHRISLPGCSNLLLSPDARFVVGKGADRKKDPDHVHGKVAVVDPQQKTTVTNLELEDFYPSTFRFDPDGKFLYVTSAATGKGAQRENLNIDTVLVFDAAKLPKLEQIRTIKVGRADCGRRPLAFAKGPAGQPLVLVPNPTDGTLSIIDGDGHNVIATTKIGNSNCEEVLFSFWNTTVDGC